MGRATAWSPWGAEAGGEGRIRWLKKVWDGALPGIPDETWARIGIFRRLHDCARKEEIFRQGEANDGLYCVAVGVVGLILTDSRGDTVTVRLATPGDLLGYRSLVCGEVHALSGIALTPAEVSHIDAATARRLLAEHPQAERSLAQRVSKDTRRAYEAYLRVATMSVRERFLHFLLIDMQRFSSLECDGTLVVPLTLHRVDIAALLGTVPETMSRTLRRLDQEGLVRIVDDTALIRDPARAWALVGQSMVSELPLTN